MPKTIKDFTNSTMIIRATSLSQQVLLLVLHVPLALHNAHAAAPVAQEAAAEALLKWKESLENHTFRNSWSLNNNGNTSSNKLYSPCNWFGVACDTGGNVVNIKLFNAILQGKLENFNFSSFPNLTTLNLSCNALYGSVPAHVSSLQKLTRLDLSRNQFSGELPPSLGKLVMLENLNLSSNMLSGSIPTSLEEMSSLLAIDFSYNNLEGPLPKNKAFQQAPMNVFIHDKGLCGGNQGFPQCKSTLLNRGDGRKGHNVMIYIILPILGGLIILIVFVAIFSFLRRQKPSPKRKELIEGKVSNLFSILNYDGRILYENIIRATENFDSKYCIGTGAYGSVYKAELQTGQVVAVKKLHPMESGIMDGRKSFINEIKALTKIRHRNIVKLFGFCSHREGIFLVYKYMERGSLAKMLSCKDGAIGLGWTKRINVVKGVAHALSYMHHDCLRPIIHRDITSNNILINSDFEACLSDFGICRLLKPDYSSWISFSRYVAPGLLLSPFFTL